MLCLACRGLSREAVCEGCRATLVPGPDRTLAGGWAVRSGYVHSGAARALVHRLKYEGIVAAAAVLAGRMVAALPSDATVLVPIPRSRWRAIRFGVDPGLELAIQLSKATGLGVTSALAPPVVARHNAGRSRPERQAPGLRAVREVGFGAVLVDDVVTTGVTLSTAIALLGEGVRGAVTATVSV